MSIAIRHRSKLMRLIQWTSTAGGFFFLLCKIRSEHRAAQIDDWHPWIPIVFCGLMLVLIPIATLFRDRWGKSVLVWCYCLTAYLGVLGLVFHSEGNFIHGLIAVLCVWSSTVQAGAAIKSLQPSLLTPGAPGARF
jgi:Na+/melibiose symporter-like transporter